MGYVSSLPLTIIIPTLNEEETIGNVIDSIPKRILERMGYETEVLVIDGGSNDKTVSIALSRGARVLIVRRRGYGLAYMIGFRFARGDIIVTLDADMTYPPDEIPKLVRVLEKMNVDFVSTNRFVKFDRQAFNRVRLLGNKLLNMLVFLFFRARIRDTQSGMWCFRKAVLNKIRLSSYGMEFSTEIKLEAARKLRYVEIPIRYRRRIGGRSKINYFKDGIRILLFIIKYRILSALGIL